jgi:chemotaxis protein MotB
MAAKESAVMIKKVKKVVGGGHHGGAWKVAYADFVTAMMAFFLLMWLINTTSPEQKLGIADYFAPASVSQSNSGSGGILGGTSLGKDGAKADGSARVLQNAAPQSESTDSNPESASSKSAQAAEAKAAQAAEQASFQSAALSLRQAMQSMPELAELSKQVIVDQTPEGLRIQLVDQEGRSMFENGSTKPNERARVLLRAVTKIVDQLPNRVIVAGHTNASDAGVGAGDGDWSLSAGRADGARKVMQQFGMDMDRVAQVTGKANSEPLFPDDPTLAGNRRISITLLREAPVLPPDTGI